MSIGSHVVPGLIGVSYCVHGAVRHAYMEQIDQECPDTGV